MDEQEIYLQLLPVIGPEKPHWGTTRPITFTNLLHAKWQISPQSAGELLNFKFSSSPEHNYGGTNSKKTSKRNVADFDWLSMSILLCFDQVIKTVVVIEQEPEV